MPRSQTTGIFTRVTNSFSDPVQGTVIDPTDAIALFDDDDTGLTFNNASPLIVIGSTSGITKIVATAIASGTVTIPAGTGTLAFSAGASIPSVAIGDLLYGSAPNVLSTLADVAVGSILISGGVSTAPAYSKTPQLGSSGTAGSLTFGNATSGLITLQPITGALGSRVVSLPAATTTLAGLSNTQVFTVAQTINLNSASAPTPAAGTILQAVQTDGTGTRFEADSFAAGSFFTARRANNTGASPTALANNDQIGAFNWHGYYVTGGPAYSGVQASIGGFASQAWTSTTLGTYVDISTTPNSSTTLTKVARFENDGGITVPNTVTGGSKGAGTINAGGLYVNGTAVTAAGITALTGDVTATGPGSAAATLATVNSNVGTFGSATQSVQFTVNGKGLMTAAANVTVTPAVGSITGLGTGVATALGNTAGGAGGFALVGTTPPTGAAGGELTGTYPNPSISRTFSPTMTGNWNFSPTSGTALTIRPAAASTGVGIDLQQSGPVTNVVSADFNFNKIQVTSDGTSAIGFYTNALYVEFDLGGANAKGGKYAGRFVAFNGTSGSLNTGGDIVALGANAQAIFPNGGTNTGAGALGTLFGADISVAANSGAVNYFVVSAAEFGTSINTGGSSKHRWGISISGNGDLRGAGSDAAIHIGAPTSTGAYTNVLYMSNDNGFAPIPTGGSFIASDGMSITTTNFVSLATYTFTGNLFDFGTPFKVTGAGVMSVPTINAFTLGGTISGGGNQINNVIIGTTTPLAGLFTTLSASTSLTSPLLIGGTGTTGTQVTFKTTTGVGTTDGFLWTRGSNGATTAMTLNNTGLGIGSVAPDQLLTVNSNTAASVAPSFAVGLHVIGADGGFGGMGFDAYGTSGNLMAMRQAGGTQASKTATVASQIVFSQVGLGWDGTSAYGTIANIRYVAINQTSPTDHSGSIVLRTVASGSTTVTDTVTVASASTTINIGDLIPTAGNIVFGTAAKTIVLKQGANGCCGTFVANGVTPVTVSNTNVAITDCIVISLNTAGGTVGTDPAVRTITAGVGFTVAGVALDSSTYNYCIIKNAA